jgi:predicted RNA-binding Zn ribbon-like protein
MSGLGATTRTLCLDFANTWGNRLDPSNDKLSSYDDLLEWALENGAVDQRVRRDLGSLARRRPTEASAVLHGAVEFRDTVFRIFSASAAGEPPEPRDIEHLNRTLADVPRRRVRSGAECCRWAWPDEMHDLARVLWPVVQSAAELVTSPDVTRVRECDAPDCNWLFLQTGRGRRRRWCDMSTCGNRAKARRYYERHRGEGTAK